MPTLDERLAALEAQCEALAMSTPDLRGTLTELRGDMNQRFSQLVADMNRRFEQVDRRFSELQGQMNRRFEHVDYRFEGVDRRFVDMQAQMNQRFDAVDHRMDRHFTWLVGILVAGLVTMIGTVAGAFFGLWQMLR
jgi:exonuclease VII large subunit